MDASRKLARHPCVVSLFFFGGLQFGKAFRTYSVIELSIRVRNDKGLEFDPISGLSPDLLAPRRKLVADP
jgi:hypothetical protein